MSNEWWYRFEGNEFGPVSQLKLESLLQGGVLSRNDYVREGAAGAWMPIRRLPDQVLQDQPKAPKKKPGNPTPSTQKVVAPQSPAVSKKSTNAPPSLTNECASASESTQQRSSPRTSQPIPKVTPVGEESPSQLGSAILMASQDSLRKQRSQKKGRSSTKTSSKTGRSATSLLRSVADSVQLFLANSGELLSRPFAAFIEFSHVHKTGFLTGIVALLLGVALFLLPSYWWTENGIYSDLMAIHAEFEHHKNSGTAEADWTIFRSETESHLKEMSQRLAPTANSDYPIRLAMLHVTRDYFPAALREKHRNSGDNIETQLSTHLRMLRQSFLRRQRRGVGLDWSVLTMIVVDGILIFAAGVWLVRRKS